MVLPPRERTSCTWRMPAGHTCQRGHRFPRARSPARGGGAGMGEKLGRVRYGCFQRQGRQRAGVGRFRPVTKVS